jgi:hypothetical protein
MQSNIRARIAQFEKRLATGYWLASDVRFPAREWSIYFTTTSRPTAGQAVYYIVITAVNWLEHETRCSLPSNAEVKDLFCGLVD